MADTDNLIYETSATIEDHSKPFSDLDWVFTTDGQNGDYNSSQVTFDGEAIGGSDRFCDWRQAYIVLPVILALSSSGTALNVEAAFAAGLKNFYVNLIDQCTLNLGTTQIHQNCKYSNFLFTFRALTEWSADDAAKWGASLGFAKDTALSYNYGAYGTATVNGDGISNNVNYGQNTTLLTAPAAGETSNQGFLQRQRMYCKDLPTTGSKFSTFLTSSQANSVGVDYHSKVAGATGSPNTKARTWFILAKIRLRDIFPAIAEMPLCKGLAPSITLSLNQGTVSITTNSASPNTMSTSASSISVSGGTFPAMIASTTAGNGAGAFSGITTGTLYLGVYVSKVNNSLLDQNNVYHPTMTKCRLYAPLVKLNPSFAPAYTAVGIKRKVRYTNMVSSTISGVDSGSSVTQLIASGVVNAKRVIIMPFYAASNTNSYSQALSPFDSAPATRMPLAAISNLNIQLATQNVWQMNGTYGYENFLHELASTTGVNGGYETGLTSGLLSELDWQTLYYTVICNIRPSPGEENVPKSVSVSFTNSNAVKVDYFVFIEFEKELTVDVITGRVEQ